jgi:hypothetical protein
MNRTVVEIRPEWQRSLLQEVRSMPRRVSQGLRSMDGSTTPGSLAVAL